MRLNDINFEVFQGERNKTKRSENVIIVKNIAKNAVVSEIQELFARYGKVNRCVMPPSKTIGIVEYQDSAHAHNAFEKLAYTEYRSLPLYLE